MADETEFMTFLREPTRENFLRIRALVVAHPAYQPYADDLAEAEKMLEAGEWLAFLEAGSKFVPNHLLTPRFHLMRSYAFTQLVEPEGTEIETVMYVSCIEGIQSTGDGSEQSPWLVMRTSDEYDLLQHMGLKLVKQSLHHAGDRTLDRMECDDGSAYWFDITDAFRKLNDQFKN
jgi:hypothetical protein